MCCFIMFIENVFLYFFNVNEVEARVEIFHLNDTLVILNVLIIGIYETLTCLGLHCV